MKQRDNSIQLHEVIKSSQTIECTNLTGVTDQRKIAWKEPEISVRSQECSAQHFCALCVLLCVFVVNQTSSSRTQNLCRTFLVCSGIFVCFAARSSPLFPWDPFDCARNVDYAAASLYTLAVQIVNCANLPIEKLTDLERELPHFGTLQEFVLWGSAQRPLVLLIETHALDEYTHDVIAPWRDGLTLVLGAT